MIRFKFLLFFIIFVVPTCAQHNYLVQEQQADSLSQLGLYDAANTIYHQLQQNTNTPLKDNDYVRIGIKEALNHQKNDEFERSINILKNAIEKSVNGVTADSLIGFAYHKLGVAYFQIADDLTAIKNWETALNFRKRIFQENHLDIIKTYRNIGSSYFYLEQYESSASFLKKSLDLHLERTSKDSFLLAQTYQDLGIALSNLRDFKPAEVYLITTLELYKRIAKDDYLLLSEVYENLWLLYHKQLNLSKMLYFATASAKIYETLPNKSVDDLEYMANAYNNLGLTYDAMDSLNLALSNFQQSININQTIPNLSKSYLAKNYNNISLIYRKLGDYPQALFNINQAIDINNDLGKNLDLAKNFNNKATIYIKLGEIDKALSLRQKSLNYLAPSFIHTNLYENPATTDLIITTKVHFAKVLSDKAKDLFLKYQKEQNKEALIASVATYDSITILNNQIRLNLESDESKSFLTTTAKTIFQQAIMANTALYKLSNSEALFDKLFQLTEQSKSMIVLDALVEKNAAQNAGIPVAVLEREKKLKEQVNALEKGLQFAPTNTDKTPLIVANRQLELLIDSLRQTYPQYAQLKYSTKTILPDDLGLTSKQTLLSYFIGEKQIYVLLIGASGKQLIEIPIHSPLSTKVQQFQRSLLTYHLQNLRSDKKAQAYADTLLTTANQLYEQLFAPIIKEYVLSKELIIIPDGVLGYLSFDLLVKDTVADPTTFALHPYLIHEYQISYAYSATLWQEMKAKEHTASRKNLVAFAPVFPGKQIASNRSIKAIKSALSPLNYNIPEVNAINQIIKGSIFTAQSATKKQFLNSAPNYKIVHLSTHGKANDEIGGYAYLAFSSIQDTLDNEILFNRDLYNVQLQADMIVLSACETGIGELQKGEGIISLARGFTYAGAKSIITTLWSINDQTTTEIMESFYTYIKKGHTKDAAIRQAKLDFIKNHPHEQVHPFYWAAFIAIGDMEVLDLSTTYQWWKVGLGIGGLFLLLFLLRKKEV